MRLQMKVTQVSPAREVTVVRNGINKNVKTVDITFEDGIDSVIVTAWDEQAQAIIDKPLQTNTVYTIDVVFTVRTTKENRLFQSARLMNIGTLV